MSQLVIYSSDKLPPVPLVSALCEALGSTRMSERGNRIAWTGLNQPNPDLKANTIEICAQFSVDCAWLADGTKMSDYALLAMDMDSTLITIECIDEIADYCGKKDQVSAITEAAMRGEITDYDLSLRLRVALLKGLSVKALEAVYHDRLRLSRGANQLIKTAKQNGLKTLLVSGGFNYFTQRVQQQLGLDFVRSNELEIVDGKLTGDLVGDIVNAQTKAIEVKARCAQLGVPSTKTIAIGDGANDMKMMAVSGFSVAYHAKPVLHSRTSAAIHYGGLETLAEWLTP